MVSFRTDTFLKRSELVSGDVYVWKDGHVRIYLGVVKKTHDLLFCTVGSMAFVSDGHPNGVMPLWGDRQVASLLGMCQGIFSLPYNASAIVTYSSLPSIYGSIGSVYSSQVIEDWLSRNRHGGMVQYSDDKSRYMSEYVPSKDLVPGCLYYGGQSAWRNTWCYLGRTTGGGYLWCFVGNDEQFKSNPCAYIRSAHALGDIQTTLSNKKVRLLTPDKNKLLAGMRVSLLSIKDYLVNGFDLRG